MAEKKVKLHGTWGSPFTNRIKIALNLKGVEYERIDEDLANKSPDLLRLNPVHKSIPVLVHGTKAIAESQVILEYIDETWESGPSIMPRDPFQRAQARFWARFIDEKLILPVFNGLILGEEQAVEELLENMKILDKELERKRFFEGESIGFVDIVASFVGYWVGAFEEVAGKVVVTKEAFPSVCKWRDEFLNCDIIRESLPTPKEKFLTSFRHRLLVLTGQDNQLMKN